MKKDKPHRVYLRVVVDQETFDEAKDVLNVLGLSVGEMIGILCKQIVLHRKLPFELKVSNHSNSQINE